MLCRRRHQDRIAECRRAEEFPQSAPGTGTDSALRILPVVESELELMIDLYCERQAPGLGAEPINALTNLAFLVSAWATWRLMRRRAERRRVSGFCRRSWWRWLWAVGSFTPGRRRGPASWTCSRSCCFRSCTCGSTRDAFWRSAGPGRPASLAPSCSSR